MTNEKKQEFTRRITMANPTEITVILYEMALCYMEDARAAKENNNSEHFRMAVSRTRGCINELCQSLHMEYEPAPVLMQLYLFCIRRLAACEAKQDILPLEEIEKVLKPLHDSFRQVAYQNPNGPVMGRTQNVYAGLTYGRTDLNENLMDSLSNRGFCV